MKISLNWLNKYLTIDESPESLAERLTLAGLEVESIEKLAARFNGFLLGKVISADKHPNADRLTVCRVDCGTEERQIVCGAPNVAAGQTVIVGLPGAVVPHDQHSPEGIPFVLREVKIRNVESFGMICSAFELGLGDDKGGIMILPDRYQAGTPLADYLRMNDTVFEIGVTPNRPDALSHIGVARDVAALYGKRLRNRPAAVRETGAPIGSYLKVRVDDPEGCPRYSARLIRNVRVGPSPEWLADALLHVGIRPVNNIVDVTNYILMDTGHPLHAFDYRMLKGSEIVVRRAVPGEKFITLDHRERTLGGGMVMICDGEKPVAIAGVMGGLDSEISDQTTDVVLEGAYFNPPFIRRTSKAFGLSTDASQRFERGADPGATLSALDAAASLIQSVAGGEIARGTIDVYPKKIKPKKVTARLQKINDILGTTFSDKQVFRVFVNLGFQPVPMTTSSRIGRSFRCTIPTYRPDILEEIDLIEEVARISGYDRVPQKEISAIRLHETVPPVDLRTEVSPLLIGRGFMEIVTNSMQDIAVSALGGREFVKIANPITKEMSSMRQSLIPGLLEVVRHNIFHGAGDLRLFEFGKVYGVAEGAGENAVRSNYREESRLITVVTGMADPVAWDRKQRKSDIFDLRGELETVFAKISLDNSKFIPYSSTDALTQTGMRVEIHGTYIGLLGSVHKKILAQYGIEQEVYVAELSMDAMSRSRRGREKFRPLAKFPVVVRDVAFIMDRQIEHQAVVEEIFRSGAAYLRSVDLFDVFQGEQIGEGKKSYAYKLEFSADDHTLTQEEIERQMNSIIRRCTETLHLSVRQ